MCPGVFTATNRVVFFITPRRPSNTTMTTTIALPHPWTSLGGALPLTEEPSSNSFLGGINVGTLGILRLITFYGIYFIDPSYAFKVLNLVLWCFFYFFCLLRWFCIVQSVHNWLVWFARAVIEWCTRVHTHLQFLATWQVLCMLCFGTTSPCSCQSCIQTPQIPLLCVAWAVARRSCIVWD